MSETVTIDLNADLGEGFDDAGLLEVVTSANVACGGHAGDAATMRAVCEGAVERGVAIGAQVSYLDRAGFGRRAMNVRAAELRSQVRAQILELHRHAGDAGGAVAYVKPHGALYHRVVTDGEQADAVVKAALDAADSVGADVQMLGLPGGVLLDLAAEAGLATVPEAFADRAYTPTAMLVPRGEPGAVIHDAAAVLDRSVAIARGEPIADAEGGRILVQARSLCVHGDTPGAAELARVLRVGMEAAGLLLASFAPTATTVRPDR